MVDWLVTYYHLTDIEEFKGMRILIRPLVDGDAPLGRKSESENFSRLEFFNIVCSFADEEPISARIGTNE